MASYSGNQKKIDGFLGKSYGAFRLGIQEI